MELRKWNILSLIWNTVAKGTERPGLFPYYSSMWSTFIQYHTLSDPLSYTSVHFHRPSDTPSYTFGYTFIQTTVIQRHPTSSKTLSNVIQNVIQHHPKRHPTSSNVIQHHPKRHPTSSNIIQRHSKRHLTSSKASYDSSTGKPN